MTAQLLDRPLASDQLQQVDSVDKTQQNIHTDGVDLQTQSYEVASHDLFLYRVAVCTLGLTILIAMIGSIVLSLFGKGTPEAIIALGSGAAGALAGFLVPGSARSPGK